jgi:ribosomal protein L29
MKNLVGGGFEGEIYPINPKSDEILGKKVYADVDDLPDGVDVAVFCIPAKFVPDTLTKVGQKGIKAAVLIPSGFAETGEEELQKELEGLLRAQFGLRMQLATQQLSNTSQLKKVKRDIARVRTVMREKAAK